MNMKLIKMLLAVVSVTLGASAFADSSTAPYLSVGNSTQHFGVYVIYQTPSKPYASQVVVPQNFATGSADFPNGEPVKIIQYYLTFNTGSSWGNPIVDSGSIIDNGCKALDKNHFYSNIGMEFTEKNGQITATCTSTY